jgi:hypothetical protein
MRRVGYLVGRAFLLSLVMGLLGLAGPTPMAHTATPLPAASHWTEIMYWAFEAAGLPDPWQLYGNPTWGVAPGRSFSGDGSLWCARSGSAGRAPAAGYANNMNGWITYGPFGLSDAIAAQWSFRYWLDGKDSGDVLRWGASADGVNYRYWAADAISGQTTGWREEVFDLANAFELGNLCGKPQVWVAIWFITDGSGTAEGAYVDEMQIRQKVSEVTQRCVLPLVMRGVRGG